MNKLKSVVMIFLLLVSVSCTRVRILESQREGLVESIIWCNEELRECHDENEAFKSSN